MGALWGVFNLVAPSNFLLLFVHPSPSLFFRLYLSEMHLFVVPFYRRRRLLVTFSQFLRLPLLRLFILYVLQLPLLFAPGTVHSVTFTQAQRGQESGTGIPGCTETKNPPNSKDLQVFQFIQENVRGSIIIFYICKYIHIYK